MERLAGGAFVFSDAHCAAPTCSPSRAAMLTGRTAHENAVTGLTHRGWDMADYNRHLAAHLGRHGFHTAWAGIQHEFADESRMPYHEWIPSVARHSVTRDAAAAAAASDWLMDKGNERPFFLWLGFFLPHVPFLKSAGPDDAPTCGPFPFPDGPEVRADWADYSASVARTDFCIGMVLDALSESGLDQSTIVVLTTDHGVPFPGMKCSLTAHGTGVTLVLRDPTRPEGGHSSALVSHLDLVPTLCALLGVETPADGHGVSLVPLLDGAAAEVRDDLFAEVNFHAAYQPMRSIRTKRWNYIRHYEPGRIPLVNIDQTRTKQWLVNSDWPGLLHGSEELFDLENDPLESRNVAGDPALAGVLAEMRNRLEGWMRRTDDPLLTGPVAAPRRARVNARHATTATEYLTTAD